MRSWFYSVEYRTDSLISKLHCYENKGHKIGCLQNAVYYMTNDKFDKKLLLLYYIL
jgi:hypothetical protein